MAKKKKELTAEEMLEEALVREEEWPYEVPGNWVWTRLGSAVLCSKEKYNDFDNSDERKYIGLEHIQKGAGIIGFGSSDEIKSQKNVFGIGDILYGKLRPYLNKHDIVSFEGICSTDILVLKTKSICVNKLMNYFLNTDYFISNAIANSKGINLPRVSEKIVLDSIFPLPPLAEQQRIVDRIESLFEKLDQAKDLIQEALDSFENRKAAILYKAFTGELTKKWREVNGVGLESWEEKPLNDIAVIVSGNAFKSQDFDVSYEVPCVKITNVGVGYYYNDNVRLPGSYLNEYKRFLVKSDDILISLTRSFINKGLKVCIYPDKEEALLNQRVAIIRCNYSNYLYYYLRTESVLNFAKEKSKTTNQPNLSINDLKNLIVPVPSNPEQLEITRILDDIFEKEQNAIELCELIDQIETIKKTILGQAFRGELGTNEPGERSAMRLLKAVLVTV
ncbi:restriction endonuclease subunit S [Acetobacterium bakii]|uniref:Type I restriction modification DNA specificity domain-containing protein n=1 Tax=Acetobacterium bakii TaxID=52689 RepID=A0A0L6TYJ8_9FIRM|nr:restriction endonuclease subunit S [Acetobacterium bakii]KNZ40650.1 hypothetical protein AKG39_16405 [Acetobacterium bakii]